MSVAIWPKHSKWTFQILQNWLKRSYGYSIKSELLRNWFSDQFMLSFTSGYDSLWGALFEIIHFIIGIDIVIIQNFRRSIVGKMVIKGSVINRSNYAQRNWKIPIFRLPHFVFTRRIPLHSSTWNTPILNKTNPSQVTHIVFAKITVVKIKPMTKLKNLYALVNKFEQFKQSNILVCCHLNFSSSSSFFISICNIFSFFPLNIGSCIFSFVVVVVSVVVWWAFSVDVHG